MQTDDLRTRWNTDEKRDFLAWVMSHRILMTDFAKAEAAVKEGNTSLDLRGISFAGAELLDDFLLFEADLRWADFSRTKLRGSFQNARLEQADFSEAFILSGYFNGAKLYKTCFSNVTCESADMAETDCRKVNFSGAVFNLVDFYGADLRGANFDNAKFNSLKLYKAKIDESQRNSAWLKHTEHLLGEDQIEWQAC